MAASLASTDAKRANHGIGIVTHSGTHHADEALAVHLLRKLPRFASEPLTRTRDAALIDRATIVVDVGATYEPEKWRFDHHQRGFDEVFDGAHGTKLSSAGLVWKHFGKEILAAHLTLAQTDATVDLLHVKLYDDFVEAIDGIDNGIPLYADLPAEVRPAYRSKTDLSSRIAHLNPSWNETLPADPEARQRDQDERFERASTLAGTEFFDRVDYAYRSWLPARRLVEAAMDASKATPRLVVFDSYVGWKDHLFTLEAERNLDDASNTLYVVYPDEAGKWRVQAVPKTPESFASRKALPEPWRGVRDDELSSKTGIPGCIFVHQSGFIGGNATKEGALKMAHDALAFTA
ncbi:metal-dependent protein hydrolase [Acaromyces ingoldii]|uniref:Metal-dependent protein hydrolase n=1 Tax=Acaromyces ingoldii TaxID=215250 RepID=A0A316YYM2_9BASI|nr:metal-dependent protein hydrolase [Acaromyces ingoldii]PWN94202.1 metal-dependent protein hydrolase [Acaromyces ingoldii]